MLPPPLWVQRSQHLGKHADPILVWCYFTIYAAGTTSYQQWVNLSCSLWFFIECSHNYLGSRVQEVIFFASIIDSQYMIYQLLGFNLIPTHLIFRDHDLNHSIRSGFCLITRSIFGILSGYDYKHYLYNINPSNAEIFLCEPWKPNVFFFWNYHKCLS